MKTPPAGPSPAFFCVPPSAVGPRSRLFHRAVGTLGGLTATDNRMAAILTEHFRKPARGIGDDDGSAQPPARAGASGPSQARARQRRSERRSSNAVTTARRPRRPPVTATSTRRPARSTAITRPRTCSAITGRSISSAASPHNVSRGAPARLSSMERTRCATERDPVRQKTTSATSTSCAATGATTRISPSSIVGVMLRPPARKRTLIPSANNPSTTDANAPRWRSGPPRLDFTDQNIGISAEKLNGIRAMVNRVLRRRSDACACHFSAALRGRRVTNQLLRTKDGAAASGTKPSSTVRQRAAMRSREPRTSSRPAAS